MTDFLQEVRSMQKSLRDMSSSKVEPKLLVHCSNGAGRSGVFVLCETLIRLIENNQVCKTFSSRLFPVFLNAFSFLTSSKSRPSFPRFKVTALVKITKNVIFSFLRRLII